METNELERRFEVEKAWENGATIQSRKHYSSNWVTVENPGWEWKIFDYRVKPVIEASNLKVGDVVAVKKVTITGIDLKDDEIYYSLSDGSFIAEKRLMKDCKNKATKKELEQIELLGSIVKSKLQGDILVLNSATVPSAVKHNYLFFDKETETWKEYGS